jgi:hypothetical protein
MYHHISVSIIIVFILTLFIVCKNSNPITPTGTIASVSFLYYGAVIPQPIKTLITFDSYFIRLLSTQNGNTINSWFARISVQEYSRLMSIINNNDLMNASDPVLPQGVFGCVGSGGLSIVMKKESVVDTLYISGPLCCYNLKQYWPSGLDTLLVFEDSLVNKYKP